jgi:hypothetical protein
MTASYDGPCYRAFMTRRRWPDVVIVVGIVTLLFGGVWSLWGEDIRGWWHHPDQKEIKAAPGGGGVT